MLVWCLTGSTSVIWKRPRSQRSEALFQIINWQDLIKRHHLPSIVHVYNEEPKTGLSRKQRDKSDTATMLSMQVSTQLRGPDHENYRPLAHWGEVRGQASLVEGGKGGFLQELELGPSLADWGGLRLVKRKRRFSSQWRQFKQRPWNGTGKKKWDQPSSVEERVG